MPKKTQGNGQSSNSLGNYNNLNLSHKTLHKHAKTLNFIMFVHVIHNNLGQKSIKKKNQCSP